VSFFIARSPRLSTRLSEDLCPLAIGRLPLDRLPSADRLIHELGVRRFLFAAVYFQRWRVLPVSDVQGCCILLLFVQFRSTLCPLPGGPVRVEVCLFLEIVQPLRAPASGFLGSFGASHFLQAYVRILPGCVLASALWILRSCSLGRGSSQSRDRALRLRTPPRSQVLLRVRVLPPGMPSRRGIYKLGLPGYPRAGVGCMPPRHALR
jgi:hypothetical protein